MSKETIEAFEKNMRKAYGPMYYDRQGKELTLMEWAKKFDDSQYRVIRHEIFDKCHVSTVWIGINMQIFRKCPIEIFETMIFLVDDKEENPLRDYLERYSTEEEAILGHKIAIDLCQQQLLKESTNER